MRKRQPTSILQLSTATLGVHRGAFAAAHIVQWIIATNELGHVPSGREYGEFWAVDDRTSWRHAADAKAVLGDDWRKLVETFSTRVDEIAGRSRSPRKLMALEVA
jgi:hypothetical protein